MGILKKLLGEIKSDDIAEKIIILCDQIFEQEKENIKHIKILPKGPNIFITLEVPGRTQGEIAFLSLERESKDVYVIVLFITTEKELQKTPKGPLIKRQRVWVINDHRPEQILTGYAKQYKFLRGE